VAREPGFSPTTNLGLTLSAEAAQPGEPLILTIHGAGADSLSRGKRVAIQVEHDREWTDVGTVIVQTVPGPGRWGLPGDRVITTAEGYPATTPMHFQLPPIPPGSHRIRIDAIADADPEQDLRHRTATLYAEFRVLPSAES
jgi:hypothetical protein